MIKLLVVSFMFLGLTALALNRPVFKEPSEGETYTQAVHSYAKELLGESYQPEQDFHCCLRSTN